MIDQNSYRLGGCFETIRIWKKLRFLKSANANTHLYMTKSRSIRFWLYLPEVYLPLSPCQRNTISMSRRSRRSAARRRGESILLRNCTEVYSICHTNASSRALRLSQKDSVWIVSPLGIVSSGKFSESQFDDTFPPPKCFKQRWIPEIPR